MEELRNELNEALLDLVDRVQRAAASQRQARHAALGIDAVDADALARLAAFPDGLTTRDWAELCERGQKEIRAIARHAIAAGWVERHRRGNARLVRLTETGTSLVERTRTATLGMFHRPLKELRLDELRTLVAALNRVLNALEAKG